METNTLRAENEGEMIPVQRLVRLQIILAEFSTLATAFSIAAYVDTRRKEGTKCSPVSVLGSTTVTRVGFVE